MAGIFLVMTMLTVPTSTAFAHAELVQTDLPGPSLPEVPAQFAMTFSEELDNGTSVRLLDANGAPLAGVGASIDRP